MSGGIEEAINELATIHQRLILEVQQDEAEGVLGRPMWSRARAWKDMTAILGAMVELERAKEAATPSASPASGVELDYFDAGLLGDGGGGDVDWWQDYIRSLLKQAHDHYSSQVAALPDVGAGVREGFVLVPKALTNEMKEAVRANGGDQAVAYALAVWPDLLKAAPTPEGKGEG